MEIKFRQEHGYGCAIYAVANVLDFESFIKPERLESSMVGGITTYDLSNWLAEHDLDFFVDTVYYDSLSNGLPKWLKEKITVEGDELTGVFLVSCEISEGGKLHMVAVRFDQTGKCLLFDSLRESVVELESFGEIESIYFKIFGVYCFAKTHDASWVFFKKSYFEQKAIYDEAV